MDTNLDILKFKLENTSVCFKTESKTSITEYKIKFSDEELQKFLSLAEASLMEIMGMDYYLYPNFLTDFAYIEGLKFLLTNRSKELSSVSIIKELIESENKKLLDVIKLALEFKKTTYEVQKAHNKYYNIPYRYNYYNYDYNYGYYNDIYNLPVNTITYTYTTNSTI